MPRRVRDDDPRRDAATGCELGHERHPSRLENGDQIIKNSIGDVFVKDPFVAKCLEVQFEALEFHAGALWNVAKRKGAKIGLPRLGANRSKFRTDNFDRVVPTGKLVDESFKVIASGSGVCHAKKCAMNQAGSKAVAVVLLSGGLDSATAASWARQKGYVLAALSLDYGQRHRVELECARHIAADLGITDHVVLPIDLTAFGGSALTDPQIPVPRGRSPATMAQGIPATYVPARNTVFLSLALAMAETRGAEAIVLGVNAIDYSGYPDCRPEYLDAFQSLAGLATKMGVEGRPVSILAPLVKLAKADIIRLGLNLGVDYGLTSSCYDPDPTGRPCNQCDSCRLRAAGFAAAGAIDPRLTAT